MNENIDHSDNGPATPDDRTVSLAAFAKLEQAIALTEEAIKECPRLKVFQLDPLLRTLAQALRFLSAKDSELDLPALMVKHEWRVGQRFYVRVISQFSPEPTFVVLPQQDIPEGVRIVAKIPKRMPVEAGERVALDLEITRGPARVSWRIRALDRE
jgi:hypothetical protein